MSNLDALDLRFAEVPPEPHRNVAGVVGLVRDGERPVALATVLGSTDPDRAALVAGKGIAEARRSLHAAALRLVAGVMDIEPEVEGVVALMRAGMGDLGIDSDYWWMDAYDPGEAEAKVRESLRGALPSADAFRVTRRLCEDLQVPGEMRILRAVQPACGRLLALADAEATLAEAAAWIERRKSEGSRDFARHAEAWRGQVAVSSPSP